MTEYIFYRDKGFYFIQLKDDKDALASVESNPGTIKVVIAKTGKIIYPIAKHKFPGLSKN